MWGNCAGELDTRADRAPPGARLQKPHSLRSYKRVMEISLRLAVHPYYSAMREGAQMGAHWAAAPRALPLPFPDPPSAPALSSAWLHRKVLCVFWGEYMSS